MSSVQSLKEEVQRELGQRKVTVPTPWTPHKGILAPGYAHRDVLHECCIFLRLDGQGAHFANATQWSQTRVLAAPSPELWFFQLLVLLCESSWFGSQRPLADSRYDARGYRTAVQLQAKAKLDMATTAELGLLKTLMRSDEYHDVQYDYDVRCEMLAAQIREDAEKQGGAPEAPVAEGAEGAAPKKRGRPQKKKKSSAVSAAASAAPAQSVAAEPRLPSPWYDAQSWTASNPVELMQMIMYWNGEEALRYSTLLNATAEVLNASAASADDAPDVAARIREAISTRLKPPAPDADRLVPKVEFCVTYVPSPSGGGLMCRFLFRDPNMDPGLFFSKIVLADIEKREMSKLMSAAGGGGGHQHAAREHFPHYRPLYEHSNHPVSKRTNRQTYFNMMTALCPEYVARYSLGSAAFLNMAFEHPQHCTHPFQVLTLARALRTMKEVGCDDAHCEGTLWRNENGPIAPDDVLMPLRSMYYMPQAVFWRNFHYLGLSEQFMPHVNADSDFLTALINGEDLRRFFPGGEHLPAPPPGPVARMFRDNWLISRESVLSQTLLDYHTNNEFMHLGARAALINKRVSQDFPPSIVRAHADIQEIGPALWRKRPELVRRVEDYDRYRQLLRKAQECCFLAFAPLWPLEGNVDDVPVSRPIRALLRWYRDNRPHRLPNMTREFRLTDDALSLFGNSMLKSLKLFASVGRIVHPSICLLSEGLFSCYRYAPRELMFNIMAHGRFDTGKTFILITTLIKLITVPNTVIEYTVETAAASTTQNHVYDEIIACDEVMSWKVDSAEAKKNPIAVNLEKVKMVAQKVGKKVFVFVKTDDGEKHRWTRLISTDHFASLVEVTNFEIEQRGALSSRSHTITVPLSRIPVRELAGRIGASLLDFTRLYFQINQYLSACAYKAMMCGAMLEPNMDLFHDISNRVLNYLCKARVLSSELGARGLEVMKPYATQLVVHQAHHYAFDMPQSPNYQKPFEVRHILEEQRYLYCTTDIVWWCWTAMACEWIVQSNAQVIEAAVASLGVGWKPGVSAYAMYERDVDERIFWRVRDPPATSRAVRLRAGADDGNSQLIDLNYITFEGTIEQVAGTIARFTEGKLSKVDVVGVLNDLKSPERKLQLPGGGMIPQPAAQFKRYHKYRVPPSSEGANDGFKETALSDGSMGIPRSYLISNQDEQVARTEKDVPRYPPSHVFSPVEIEETGGKHYVHIMPMVADNFKTDVIVDALMYATMCKTTRPGKTLLGLVAPHDSMQLQVHDCPADLLAYYVDSLDREEGFINGKWVPPPGRENTPEIERPVPRREGIAFPRRANIGALDAEFINSVPLVPVTAETREQTLERSRTDLSGMQGIREVIRDLDYHSARVQHLRAGLPIDDPVHDPAWIEAEFKLRSGPDQGSNHRDYPNDWLLEFAGRDRAFDVINDTRRQQAWFTAERARKTAGAAAAAAAAAPQQQPQAAATGPRMQRTTVAAPAAPAEAARRQAVSEGARDQREAQSALAQALFH